MAYTRLSVCVACGSPEIKPILNLREQPLANSYHKREETLPEFPLAMNVCPECFHAQQAVAVDPDLMFKQYAYVSGTSETLRNYFDSFAKLITERRGAPGRVLDIACNDGSQLAAFKKYGWEVYGVDPAENLVDRARAIGATVLCEYWTSESAKKLGATFDSITAQNVFAHVADPLAFLETCKLVMAPDSKLYIQTSQAEMIARGEFDTIYHEHISFFSANSMRALVHRAGLYLEDVFITPVHGGSYVFVVGHNPDESKAETRLKYEEAEGRYDMRFFHRFAEQAQKAVNDLKNALLRHTSNGRVAVGFGAAAKGNTLLNFGKIQLEYIVDENPLKQNLYTPGMNIPIVAPSILEKEERSIIIVPLAWNFFDEIHKKVTSIREGKDDIFITYFPDVIERS